MTLRIALAQFDFPVGAVRANAERIAVMIAEARDEYGADLVMFPELALSGYPPEDLLLRPELPARLRGRDRDGRRRRRPAVSWRWSVGREAAGSVVYNAASVLRDGKCRAAPIANANCRITRCSTSAAISMSIRIVRIACSTSKACRSG